MGPWWGGAGEVLRDPRPSRGDIAPSRRPGVARSRQAVGAASPPTRRRRDQACPGLPPPPDVIAHGEVDGMARLLSHPPNSQGCSDRAIPETCPAASVCFNLLPPCHAPAARSAGGSLRPGARREARRRVRAVRPGLKTYRKFSPSIYTGVRLCFLRYRVVSHDA